MVVTAAWAEGAIKPVFTLEPGVLVFVAVGVFVGVLVGAGVFVGVPVLVAVAVMVGVFVGKGVFVGVLVCPGVAVGTTLPQPGSWNEPIRVRQGEEPVI